MRPYILLLALAAQTSKGTETLEAMPAMEPGGISHGWCHGWPPVKIGQIYIYIGLPLFKKSPNICVNIYIIYIGKCTDVLLHDM